MTFCTTGMSDLLLQEIAAPPASNTVVPMFCGIRVAQHFLTSISTILHLTKQILEASIRLLDWSWQNVTKKGLKIP
jgi:uncharacterized membrane protein